MPTVAEEPKTVEEAQDRQSPFAHRLARSILRLAIVLAIAAAISGGWYLARKGFGGRARGPDVGGIDPRGGGAGVWRPSPTPFFGLGAPERGLFTFQESAPTPAVL